MDIVDRHGLDDETWNISMNITVVINKNVFGENVSDEYIIRSFDELFKFDLYDKIVILSLNNLGLSTLPNNLPTHLEILNCSFNNELCSLSIANALFSFLLVILL